MESIWRQSKKKLDLEATAVSNQDFHNNAKRRATERAKSRKREKIATKNPWQ